LSWGKNIDNQLNTSQGGTVTYAYLVRKASHIG